jgi:peptide/nickel transport system permease protein
MKFYVRRIAFYVLTLWFAVTLNFVLPRLLPGDPATILLQKLSRLGGEVTPAMIRSVELLLGTDDGASMWSQYWSYIGSIFRGDLGISISNYPAPVTTLIGEALPWTLALVGTATVLSFLLGIFGGAWVGWKRGTWADNVIPATTLLQSVPYFWLALLLVYIFSVSLGWFPIIGGWDTWTFDNPEASLAFFLDALRHATLPAITIILSSVGGWLLGMRNMTVSTLSEDYITTAEAKGLRPSRIFMTYTVRNASLPSIAGFTIALGFVVSGSIVMEQVFTYPGLGRLMIQAVQGNDYALMQGVFLVITLTVLAANFIMDMFYGFIDPRARHNG